MRAFCERHSTLEPPALAVGSSQIGSENSTGIICEDEDEFIEQIREEIRRAEEEGREHFDITIEQSE